MRIPSAIRRAGVPAGLALGFAVGGLVEAALSDYQRGHRPLAALFALLVGASFLPARRAPLLVPAGFFPVMIAAAIALPKDAFNNLVFGVIAFIAASYVAGTSREWRLAVPASRSP